MSKSFKNNLTGQRFGRLTVLEFVPREGTGRSYWKCECDCGNITEVSSNNLKSNGVISCGCLSKELNAKKARLIGYNNRIHGKTNTKIYRVWKGIKARCYNPNQTNYKNYGGRGITICAEWQNDFQAFYDWAIKNGYREGLSIDRIDNDGNYEPSNCRWTNAKTQARNTRNTTIVEYNGKKMCLSEAAELSGISVCTLSIRHSKGERGEVLFRPVRKKK